MAVLFGKYQLIAQLGEGGMAQVFLAAVAGPKGSGFSKLTVVKRLRATYEDDAEFITMLMDEARIAARLNHPNVVQTHEVGDVDGRYFIAMEYLDGHSYHRIHNRSRARIAKAGNDPSASPVTDEMGYAILSDVLAGLHHAHELADYDGTPLGIVHRDITPQNIFVTYEGQVKLLDFGIAKAAGNGSETRHGVIKGKVRYMAPEQAIGREVDRRADLFSVGVLLWELGTKTRRWKDETEGTIIQALLRGECYLPMKDINPDVPPEIDAICKKALALQPQDRYQTAEEFRNDLEAYLATTSNISTARSKLGAVVNELFKDKRAELKACIEQALMSVGTDSSPSPLAPESTPMMLPGYAEIDRSSKRELGSNANSASKTFTPVDVDRRETSELMSPPPHQRGWQRAAIAAAVALVVVVGVGGVALKSKLSGNDSATSSSSSSSSSTAENNKAPAARATTEQVSISVSAAPPTARITVDGALVATPYETKVDRSTASHTVQIEADGYEPQTKTLVFDQSVVLAVSLNKASVAQPGFGNGHSLIGARQQPPAAPITRVGQGAAPVVAKTGAPDAQPAPVGAKPPPTTSNNTATGDVPSSPSKKDIDRSNPFATGTGTAKALDKSNPFSKGQ